MLWIGICETISVAAVGGFIGGCITSISNKSNNKWNLRRTEEYLNKEIYQIQITANLINRKLSELETKLSTISVVKPVGNRSKSKETKVLVPSEILKKEVNNGEF